MPSRTFTFTGDWQRWAVPDRVTDVSVTLNGGGSGTIPAGRVSGRLKVTDRDTLYVAVGRAGRGPDGSTGGGGAFTGGASAGDGSGAPGGWGGGGASAIRVNSPTGAIRAVAGGAGGSSGDGGHGGQGGGDVGQFGSPGPGSAAVGNATGGTPIQGGNGGTSVLGASYGGQNASDAALSPGGRGGTLDGIGTIGGGGGGGGYHGGGGGQAGLLTVAPAGGGGGGSNFVGGLYSYSNGQGTGGTGDGSVTITWNDPPPANQAPSPPTEVKVGGQDAVDGMATYSTGQLSITAKVDDPNTGQTVRLVAVYSNSRDFSRGVKTVVSAPVAQASRANVTLSGLSQDTLYYARLYTRDSRNNQSVNYKSINFWTNRRPIEPTISSPANGATVSQLDSVVFAWVHHDPDPSQSQRGFQLRWRLASTPITPAGQWTIRSATTTFRQYTANPGTFKANLIYEWQVRTQDQERAWGAWSITSAFFVTGAALAPYPLEPNSDEAVDVTVPVEFSWRFRDPDQGDTQSKADVRYRLVDTPDWQTLIGTLASPGGTESWVFDPGVFAPGYHYEWQARTTDTLSSALSDWSESETFWGTVTPGSSITNVVVPVHTIPRPELGQGQNRAFIYDRGGRIYRGEIGPTTSIQWGRTRDDIATATIITNGFGEDGGAFYSTVHTWMHEVVIYRDDERVFEGPITAVKDAGDHMEFTVKDVMGWVYRRILRQGYNDSYRVINGEVQGDFTIVQRAAKIIQNALAPDDPNILEYLTTFDFPDDAGESRVVQSYTRTAWEDLDDMAANAGLDYTTVGRRIILNDTHRPIGRLAEMRSEHFSDPPVITEYGLQLATYYGVTNGAGIWGAADKGGASSPYGLVELLSSSYGESAAAAGDVLTSKEIAELEKVLSSQAERNIASRYPAPVQVRVPDNSSLDPAMNVGINDLIPGVWIPLRAKGGCLEIAQWQKLDTVTVTQDSGGERVQVTMTPAPNGGDDPDSDQVEGDQ